MEDFEKRQMMKDVGARVYALRTAANMSRETLAERLNITPQYVSEIEQGKKCMNMSIFAELGRVFHRGLDDLAWGEAPADPGLDGPVDRDMAIHILHLTFRSIQELGREP